jgi:RHS repeat-associated protein
MWADPTAGGSTAAESSYLSIDRNGNKIVGANGVYTDTLGVQELTVNGKTVSYVGPSGSTETATVSYKTYNIQTNFGCSSITEYRASDVSLVSAITLPDSTSYQFTYEQTPDYSGYVTGRLASITLPTGGEITYSYSDGNNGIECADGSTATLTRTTLDGTWTYARTKNSSSLWTTTTTAPAYAGAQDQTVSTFLTNLASTNTYFYEIKRQIYSGLASGGSLLKTILTCYESSDSSCSSSTGDSGSSVSSLTRVKVTEQWPNSNGISSGYLDTYDSFSGGGVYKTSHTVYDYGSSGSGTFSTSPLQTTTMSYEYFHGSGTSSGSYKRPTDVLVTDSYGATVSETQLTYDGTSVTATSSTPSHVSGVNGGNLTMTKKLVSGGSYLTSTYTYYDTGNLKTATDANGKNVTTYLYGGCTNSFPTSTSTPVRNTSGTVTSTLTSSQTWDCNGGVMTSSTDANGQTTTYGYGSDPFWRPVSVTDPAGNVTYLSYPTGSSPNTSSSSFSFNGGSSVNNTVITTDGLGRTLLEQKQQGPSVASYDSIAVSYDSRGRISCQTAVPYSASAGDYTVPESGCVTYDPLGRMLQSTDAGGGTVTNTYNLNDVLVAVGPAPSGESPKQRSLEYNAAGQLTSVCEVTSLRGAGSCGQNTSYTGYLTKYTYDGSLLTKTQQNVQAGSSVTQTRTISYDYLGRKLSESIPEWSAGTGLAGSARYVYDSDSSGICSGSSAGDLIKTVDSAGNVTCFTYDSLHRVLTAKVVSGTYASVTPVMNYVYDRAAYGSTAMQNTQGNLAEAFTGTSSSKTTDLYFSNSYSGSGGMVSQVWEATPNSNGYFLTTDSYYANGALGARTTSYGAPSMSYGLDGEGRMNTATDATNHLSLVTGTSYNTAGAATSVSYGNGDSDSFGYNAATNRPQSILYTVAGNSPFTISDTLTWNANGALQQMQIQDTNDTAKNQTCAYSADDLQRLTSVNCGSDTWAQNFSYDAFGNINKSGSGNYAAAYYALTNQVASGVTTGYDANGNQLSSTGLSSISWNAAGHPVSVTALSGNAIAGTYDALGRLVETASGGSYTQFVFSPAGTKVAVVQGGTLVKGTIPLPGGETAIYNAGGLNFIRHNDWLGSSRLGTTWAHAVYSKESYAPFGETYDEAGTPDRSFTGQDQDTVTGSGATGVYDFLFRKYDPAAGRWISPDPAGWSAVSPSYPQSLNRYAYVLNNPNSLIDPSGLTCWWSNDDSDDTEKAECVAGGGTYQNDDNNSISIQETVVVDGGGISNVEQEFLGFSAYDAVQLSALSLNPYYQFSSAFAVPNNPAQPCHCFNTQAFANELNANANDASTGWCGRYVGWALDAGGTPVGSHAGGDYGPYLTQAGFVTVPLAGYSPQQGDIAIFQRSTALRHPSGHSAGYNGSQWVSDFFQRHMSPYSPATTPPVTIYRSGCHC